MNLWNDFLVPTGNWLKDTVNSFTGKRANDISAQNLQAQKEELDYQHALQERVFEREDTGYQRAVADARAAGLSALSVSGPSNAGGVVSTTAPQQETNNIGIENGMNALNMFATVLGNVQQLQIQNKLADSQIAQQAANTSKTLAEIDDMNLRNPITRNILSQQYSDLQFNANKNNWLWNNGEKDNLKNIWDINKFNNKRNELAYYQDLNDFNYLSRYGLSQYMTIPERQQALKSMLNYSSRVFDSYRFDSRSNKFFLNTPNSNFIKNGKHIDVSNDYLANVLNANLWQLYMNTVLPMAQKMPFGSYSK